MIRRRREYHVSYSFYNTIQYRAVFITVSPVIKVTNQLVAAPVNSDVVLQCHVEASPQALNTWHQNTGR